MSHSGSTIQWLRGNLEIIEDVSEVEALAAKTDSNDSFYFYPVFAGLFARYAMSILKLLKDIVHLLLEINSRC